MGWHDKGDERGKKYAVYQRLEAEHKALQSRLEEVLEELRRKEITLRVLAQELYKASSPPTAEEVQVAIEAVSNAALDLGRATPERSEATASPGPGLSKTGGKDEAKSPAENTEPKRPIPPPRKVFG